MSTLDILFGRMRDSGLPFEKATKEKAEAGTDPNAWMTPLQTAQAIAKLVAPAKFESALLHIREEYAAGTNGGTGLVNVWNTRTLNTLRTNEIGASLASNVITLSAGTYFSEGSAPAYNSGSHQIRLWNITDNLTALNGSSESNSSSNVQTRSFLSGRFTIASAKQFRLEHYITVNSGSSSAFGLSTNAVNAGPAIFSDLKIWKVA